MTFLESLIENKWTSWTSWTSQTFWNLWTFQTFRAFRPLGPFRTFQNFGPSGLSGPPELPRPFETYGLSRPSDLLDLFEPSRILDLLDLQTSPTFLTLNPLDILDLLNSYTLHIPIPIYSDLRIEVASILFIYVNIFSYFSYLLFNYKYIPLKRNMYLPVSIQKHKNTYH